MESVPTKRDNFKNLLNEKIVLSDGAMGTMIQKLGILEPSTPPPVLNITNREDIVDIHRQYVDSGSDIVSTNTFEANRYKLKDSGYSVEEVVRAGIECVKESGARFTALSIGPTGNLLEPLGDMRFEEAYDAFKEIVTAGTDADLILFETFSDLNELRAAVLAAVENTDLPVVASMTFSDNLRTFTGTDPKTFTYTVQELGVDALGVNCSLGPEELVGVVEEITDVSKLPVIVQANAGLPQIVDGESVYTIGAEEYAKSAKKFLDLGVNIIGGCCGTNPEYIRRLSELREDYAPEERASKTGAVLTTPTGYYDLNSRFTVIGERINPTGREHLKRALVDQNYDIIYKEAIAQEEEGADIIDVNLGLPEIDEGEVLKEIAIKLPSFVNTPLQLDSAKSEAIEKALRVYPGIALVNSVNAGEKSLETILPLVKKYGACVIGLTLDENGIPDNAEDRLKLAKRIVDRAAEYGIDKERIIIDTLALTASAGVEASKVCLEAAELIGKELGVKTSLGVSNVSFGLPNRELFNAHFLSYALRSGLSAAIINTASKPVMDAVEVYRVFESDNTDHYINTYADVKEEPKREGKGDLKDYIIEGITENALEETKRLLETVDETTIIEEYFIPALDIIGERYERGEIFLPQLMQSASSVKSAFDLLREGSRSEENSRGKILIATVEGDIHDIGKNIVKMMLENYGFEVVDLGADVKIERIVKRLERGDITLVGLSALMTTTVESMQKTIEAIKDYNPDINIVVGGAVLTPDYAKMIGADYYAEDAQKSVRIATDYFNKL